MKTPNMKRVALEEATVEQMFLFASDHAGLEASRKMKRPELVELLTVAGYGNGIFVVETVETGSPGFTRILDESDEYDPENERWCKVKFALSDGTNRNTPVAVSVNEVFAYLPRGQMLVIRERLFHHIRQCKETRYFQNENEFGEAVGKFSEVAPREIERYPLSFYGYCGFVKDGIPEVGENVLVIPPEGSASTQARASAITHKEARKYA